ncbi:hypothetical protein [Sporosarcina sp. UB5]|uniref:hypothetical protein n=1 Tax=Sporosarcina sp. UB5 TaxID=3047463 RepID=UPI003D7ADA5A
MGQRSRNDDKVVKMTDNFREVTDNSSRMLDKTWEMTDKLREMTDNFPRMKKHRLKQLQE